MRKANSLRFRECERRGRALGMLSNVQNSPRIQRNQTRKSDPLKNLKSLNWIESKMVLNCRARWYYKFKWPVPEVLCIRLETRTQLLRRKTYRFTVISVDFVLTFGIFPFGNPMFFNGKKDFWFEKEVNFSNQSMKKVNYFKNYCWYQLMNKKLKN